MSSSTQPTISKFMSSDVILPTRIVVSAALLVVHGQLWWVACGRHMLILQKWHPRMTKRRGTLQTNPRELRPLQNTDNMPTVRLSTAPRRVILKLKWCNASITRLTTCFRVRCQVQGWVSLTATHLSDQTSLWASRNRARKKMCLWLSGYYNVSRHDLSALTT